MGNFDDNKKIDGFLFDCRWSDNLDTKYVNDYLFVQKKVFDAGSLKEFNHQFIENIYGLSIIIVVYVSGIPIAARAVWRNDIEGEEAYQLGAVCVLPEYRGRGLFSEMTKRAIRMLPSGTIVYSFPNSNSFPGHKKMGWDIIREYRQRLFVSYRQYAKEHPQKMDQQYAFWWVKERKLLSMKRFGHFFLVQKDKRSFCYRIIAEIDANIESWFPSVKFGVFFYKSEKKTWYNCFLASSHLVCKNPNPRIIIPLWKMDAI